MATDPKLTGVKIRFMTHDDNRDHDTRLNVVVKDRRTFFFSEVLAEGIDLAPEKEFVDPSTHEYGLALKSKSTRMSDLIAPFVEIDIDPNGNDTWIFDYTVIMTFDDGSSHSAESRGVILDQDNRHYKGIMEG